MRNKPRLMLMVMLGIIFILLATTPASAECYCPDDFIPLHKLYHGSLENAALVPFDYIGPPLDLNGNNCVCYKVLESGKIIAIDDIAHPLPPFQPPFPILR